ncbi:WD40 repeat-like protein [Testicularia cyperi]|uniref:WD40 repeat-like protein n=1 Tax=Testicularia cyperi TaxID=1882483 RepID=A0A317XXY4_9BASI|nr:WD40 repeat-like protein [Testicularia cyperi]
MAKSNKRSRQQPSAADNEDDNSRTKYALGTSASNLPGSKKRRAPPPPAEEELDLEKLIFGGSSSLLSMPSSSSANRATDVTGVEEADGDQDASDEDLIGAEAQQNGIADDQLFMLDTASGDDDEQRDGSTDDSEEAEDQLEDGLDSVNGIDQEERDHDFDIDGPSGSAHQAGPSSSSKAKNPKRTKKCVWSDPDDATLTIALEGKELMAADGSKIGTARLRKLRQEVGESHINGLEYELRLRSQFEKLHPRPVWASLRLLSRSAEAALEGDEDVESVSSASIINEDASKTINDLLRSDSGLVEGFSSRQQLDGISSAKSIKARGKLRAGEIELDRLRNANDAQTSMAVVAEEDLPAVEMVRFHPSARASVLMTASKDRRVRLFQIDGKANPLLQTVHVPDLPIQNASFHPTGSSVLISGNRPFLYAYDLQAGRVIRSAPWRGAGSLQSQNSDDDGAERSLASAQFQPRTAEEGNRLLAIGGRRGIVHLLDWGRSGAAGGTRIGGVRMNAALAGFTWDAASVLGDRGTGIGITGTGKDVELLTMSTEGSIHLWDIRNTGVEVGCSSIWNDAGSFGAKGLSVSPNGKFWTVGSESGIVNVYKRPSESYTMSSSDSIASTPSSLFATPKFESVPGGAISPVKTIENLVTSTSTMRWNHDGQILALASKSKKDALKLVHFPSMRVFSNWPTSGTPLGAVSSVDFSPSSQYLAIGNTRGKVLLYSLRHYL